MAVYYSNDKVVEITTKHGENANDTGNPSVQVALMTYRIEQLSGHLRTFKKDFATRRSLLMLVGKRKRLLAYIAHKDITKYRALIAELGLRK